MTCCYSGASMFLKLRTVYLLYLYNIHFYIWRPYRISIFKVDPDNGHIEPWDSCIVQAGTGFPDKFKAFVMLCLRYDMLASTHARARPRARAHKLSYTHLYARARAHAHTPVIEISNNKFTCLQDKFSVVFHLSTELTFIVSVNLHGHENKTTQMNQNPCNKCELHLNHTE